MPDQLGSVRDVLDGTTGTRVASYDFTPYGATSRSSVTNGTDYQYAGLFYHPASGLNFATLRAMDGGTGRWINRDPIRESAGTNLYAYGSNPVNGLDPSGLFETEEDKIIRKDEFNTGGPEPGDEEPRPFNINPMSSAGPVCPRPPSPTTTGAGAASGGPTVPPSIGPGTYAGPSIPAGPSPRPTSQQQSQINQMGNASGCHTCGTTDPGTKSGNFVGDHQPPTSLNQPGSPQIYLPQCINCSRSQGGQIRQQIRQLLE